MHTVLELPSFNLSLAFKGFLITELLIWSVLRKLLRISNRDTSCIISCCGRLIKLLFSVFGNQCTCKLWVKWANTVRGIWCVWLTRWIEMDLRFGFRLNNSSVVEEQREIFHCKPQNRTKPCSQFSLCIYWSVSAVYLGLLFKEKSL